MKNYQKVRVSDLHLFCLTFFQASTQLKIPGLFYHPYGYKALPEQYG